MLFAYRTISISYTLLLVSLYVCVFLPYWLCGFVLAAAFVAVWKGKPLNPAPLVAQPITVCSCCQTSSNTRRETGWMDFSHTHKHTNSTVCLRGWVIRSSCVGLFRDKKQILHFNLSFTHCVLTLYTTQVIWGFQLTTIRHADCEHTTNINTRLYLLMFHLSRTYNTGYIKHNIVRYATLGMLVHGTWRGSHSTVPPWSHAHALHLSIAGVIGHSLLMHGFHGLIKRGKIIIHDKCSCEVVTFI